MRGARGRRLGLAACAVLLVALGVAVGCAGPFLVVSVPPRHPDVIVSLASHEWERLPAVVAAARRYPSATVVLTVPSPVTEHNCHRCSERPLWLAHAGIDAHRIQVLSDPVASTHDEALAVLRYAASAGSREIHVVTSPYH